MENEFAVDLEDLNPGVWFYFDEEEPEKGGFCVRPMDSDSMSAIDKETIKTKKVYKRGKRYDSQDVDNDRKQEMIIDHTLTDWCVYGKDGEKIECSVENKLKLLGKSPWHQRFYINCLATAGDIETQHQRQVEKN